MDFTLIGAAAVATVGWLLYRFGSPLGSLLRSTAPAPAPTTEGVEVAAPVGVGIHEVFMSSLAVQKQYFDATGRAFKSFNEVCDASKDARKQLSLPLEGAK
jgi:hypothetical protein